MSGIYKGYNPIFESFKKEIFEQENKIDLDALDRAIYDTFVRTILGGSNQDIKTPEGFKNYIEGTLTKTSNFDSLQQEVLKKFDERIKEEPGQKQALTDLKTYITQLFTSLKPAIGNDAAAFKGLLDKILDYSKGTIGDLQKLKVTLQEKEDLVSKYLIEQRTGEEDKSEDGVNNYKGSSSFATYKNLADEAVSFNGEMSSAISNSKLASDPNVQRFAAMATKFLADSQKLAITKDGGFLARVRTAGDGKINRKQYREQCAALHNDIIRQREEWHKVLGQLTNVPPPPITATVCSIGQIWDKNLKLCVTDPNYKPASTAGNAGGSGTSGNSGGTKKKIKKGTGGSSGSSAPCTFPVTIGASACDDIKKLQTKISGIGSCVDDILRANGGIDGLYGKTTAKLTSIIYNYLLGSSENSKDYIDYIDLSKEIFDKIMSIKLHEAYIYKIDDKSFNSILEKNLFVKEYETGNPVISFSDFSKVLEQSSSSKKSFADCVCETYKTGKISPECKNVKPEFGGGDGSTSKDGGTGSTNEGSAWKGLKPAQSGLYIISYDESTGEAILQVTEVTVGVTAIVLTAGAAAGALMPEAAVGGVAGFTGTLATIFGGTGLIGGAEIIAPVAIGAGTVAGLGTAWWETRCNVGISTVAGFISRTGMRKIVRGMTNTTDGYVGHKDLTAIMATLCLLKGTWTTNASRDKALSGWGEFKRLFAKENKIDIKSEINKVGTMPVKDCEDFPDFDSKDLSEGDTINAEDAKQTILEAIDRLDKNESNIEANIKDITSDDIEKVYEGTKLTKKEGGSENKETEEKTPKKVGL